MVSTHYVDESLDGLCAAFPSYVQTGPARRVIARRNRAERSKVGVVTGGGFGHLPVLAGYVGRGLLNACAVGDVFAGPPSDVCADAIRAAHAGAGVVCVLGNYGGDRMSFSNCEVEWQLRGGFASTARGQKRLSGQGS